jgi:hypothetical protein
MKLEDKAADRPDVKLARDSAPGAYTLTTDDLVAADDLTDEGEFPEFGDFLEVERPGAGRRCWIECPADLARWLVGHDLDESERPRIEIGETFRIRSVSKVDNEWSYECEAVADDVLEDALGVAADGQD